VPVLQVVSRASGMICEGRFLGLNLPEPVLRRSVACRQPAVWRVISRLRGELRGTVEMVLCDECFLEALAKVRAQAGWVERSSSFTR